MLYRSTDRRCRRGAPMQNLAHGASFDSEFKGADQSPGSNIYLWLVDPAAGTVSQREITVDDRTSDAAIVRSGLEPGMRMPQQHWAAPRFNSTAS